MTSKSTPTTAAESRLINASCMDYLNMEMVDLIVRTSSHLSEEAVFYKLERLGYRVGQRLVERYTKDRTRFQDNLEIIKFICKEFWVDLYKKPIDNLRTNHRGVFVLHDNKFRWLRHLSTSGTHPDRLKDAQNYVVFPCGLIRGALANLGLPCIVNADFPNLPACIFTIKINKA